MLKTRMLLLLPVAEIVFHLDNYAWWWTETDSTQFMWHMINRSQIERTIEKERGREIKSSFNENDGDDLYVHTICYTTTKNRSASPVQNCRICVKSLLFHIKTKFRIEPFGWLKQQQPQQQRLVFQFKRKTISRGTKSSGFILSWKINITSKHRSQVTGWFFLFSLNISSVPSILFVSLVAP